MNFGAPPAVAPRGSDDPAAEALAALGGHRGMVQTKTQYQTAVTVQKPRDLDAIRIAVCREAGFARESFVYAWEQKDKSSATGKAWIEGVSIEGAMILARNWGNAVCEPDLVDETPTHWLLKATFIDFETGFNSARLFRQRKSQRVGKHDEERSLDIAFQIGQSKAIRNAIVRSIPQWLVDEAVEAAKAAAEKRYADVAAHAARAIAGYEREHKITLSQLERKLGKKRPDWIPSDLVLLSSIFRAIKEGQTSVGAEFSEDEQPSTPDVSGDAGPAVVTGQASGSPLESTGTPAAAEPVAGPQPAAAKVDAPADPPAAAEPAAPPKPAEPEPGFVPPTSKKGKTS